MISVLYVDDEPALLEIAKIYVEASGEFSLDTLTSATDAISVLKSRQYDVIISDYQMPEMDGIAFIRALRHRGNTTPFIIFTGKGREEIVIQALNEGVDFYLQKGGEPRSQFAELQHKLRLAVERKRSERAILHFNRLYAVLSAVNSTIVRAKTRNELFSEICRITVENGGFTMAWIGLVNNTRRTLEPAACYGLEEGYLQSIQISIDDTALGQSPGGRAVRERSHVIYNDILNEPRMKPWYPELEKQGYRSSGAFPLFIHNVVVGTLQLYSVENHFFSEGEVRLLDEVASDISFALERLEAEEHRAATEMSLKESEEKLTAVVAGSPVPKFVIDQNHRIISWNRALELMTGIPASAVMGTRDHWRAFYQEERPTMADLILEGAHEKIRKLYAEKIVDSPLLPDAVDVIDFFPHLGEKGRWLRFMASPIRNEQGSMFGAVETLIDITPIKNSEEELRKSYAVVAAAEEELRQQFDELVEKEVRLRTSEERYRQFIETANEGVWSMDSGFCTTFVNQRLAEMLGYFRNEMIGRPITAFMHPDDLADNTRRLADRQQGRTGRYERRFLNKNGTTVHTLVSTTPLFLSGTFTGSFAMITDISDRIAAECALQLANRRLKLMSSVTRHDLLNAITSSRGYLAMARQKGRDPGLLEILKRLEMVIDAMETQISFTRVYQDIGSSPPVWQDIGRLVKGCKSATGTRIVSEIFGIEVLADPLITNVFANLLDNSLRHGEHVSDIHVHAQACNTGLVIVWEDNGAGIPNDEKELIFDRGYGKNTGLGLFLVREILSITGLTIRENGEPDKGARFEISLPPDRFRIVPAV